MEPSERRGNVNGTARSRIALLPYPEMSFNQGTFEETASPARQSPKSSPKYNQSSLRCSRADSVVCLNVGGRIESKIVSGEKRHRQSRGEESLREFKPVSEWRDEIGAGGKRERVCYPRFCQEEYQLGDLFEIRFPPT